MFEPAGLACLACREPGLIATPGPEGSGVGDGALVCDSCGVRYPVLAGVPVMFPDATPLRSARPDRDTARQVLRAFGLPNDLLSVERLRRLFTRRARYGELWIETEAAQFLDRVRSSGHDIGSDMASPAAAPTESGRDRPCARWTVDYIPRRQPPGHEFMANARFENIGQVTLRRAGDGRMSLCVQWSDDTGRVLAHLETRTPLPVDMAPGRGLTVPLRIASPHRPGVYRMRMVMVQEGVGWLDDSDRLLSITIAAAPFGAIPPHWDVRPEPPRDYDTDHLDATALLQQWLSRLPTACPRILEVGGNVHPVIARCDGDLINVDVDLLGLQIGLMVADDRGQPIRQVCANAEDLPFSDGAFDAIVIAASLHHFPDPARLLAHLRVKLAPGGFVALLCEPVGHIWPGAVEPNFLAELEKGVNEQSFSLPEYAGMIRHAGLSAIEARIDGNSLKACLVPGNRATGAA